MKLRKKVSHRGFTLIEVLVSAVIFALAASSILAGIVMVQKIQFSQLTQANIQVLASSIASQVAACGRAKLDQVIAGGSVTIDLPTDVSVRAGFDPAESTAAILDRLAVVRNANDITNSRVPGQLLRRGETEAAKQGNLATPALPISKITLTVVKNDATDLESPNVYSVKVDIAYSLRRGGLAAKVHDPDTKLVSATVVAGDVI